MNEETISREIICDAADLLRLKAPQGDRQRAWRKKPENKDKERKRDRHRRENEVPKQERRKVTYIKIPPNTLCCFCNKPIAENEKWEKHHFDYNAEKEGKEFVFCHAKCHRKLTDIFDGMLRTGFLSPDVGEYMEKIHGWKIRKRKKEVTKLHKKAKPCQHVEEGVLDFGVSP